MTSFTVNVLQPVLSIVTMISFWKIFEDRGEKGWKALVPILSTLTLGKVAKDSKHAKGRVISGIALFVSMFLLLVAYFAGYTNSQVDFQITDMNDINGVVISEQFSDNGTYTGNPLILFIFLGLMIVSIVFYLINHIKLCKSFDMTNAGPSWMIILWIFFPVAAAVYYAFIHHNYDIPGITNKVVEDQQDNIDQ